MKSRPVIYKVFYRWGMVDDPKKWQGLTTVVLGQAELSEELVNAIFDNDLLTAGGVYGIPEAGDPLQINSLQIFHEHGVTDITVYNLAIMLFSTNEEIYPRILRVCGAIEKQMERPSPEKIHVNRNASKKPAGTATQAQPPLSAPDSQQVVFQIRVVLQEIVPSIWRRFLVPSNVTLHRLHLILQDVMGWTNSHLYRFQFGTQEYGEPDPDNEFNELNFKNSRRTKLNQLITKKGEAFIYEYDFGDGWAHVLIIENILEHKEGTRHPICLAGERAGPPEDCGGPPGYAGMLEVISDPEHDEYVDTIHWLGGRFDPEKFNLKTVNNKLSSMRVS